MSISVDKCNSEGFRYNCLHMVGLENMSEDDVFAYLKDYEPMKIEWIDDTSCLYPPLVIVSINLYTITYVLNYGKTSSFLHVTIS